LFKTIANIFKIAELRNKILFTLGMLCIYRIGFYIPIPGVIAKQLDQAGQNGSTVFGAVSNYLSMFSGGSLSQSTIFGLGIMPYISASIILQLLATVYPPLEKLRKEGEPGMRKITEWTRYLTVAICIIQAAIYVNHLVSPTAGLVVPMVLASSGREITFWAMGLTVLTAGSVFLMWLGEQIDAYGIGNGVSLIITAGILSRMPAAILPPDGVFGHLTASLSNTDSTKYSPPKVLFLVACFVFVVAGSILLTQAQRRIKIQQAKQMRGRQVYGGQAQYLPLRVNHAGVMPIIFASSLMLFPSIIFKYADEHIGGAGNISAHVIGFFTQAFQPGNYVYEVLYVGMIFFFSYFWNTVQFQPKELANQLRDYGSFIPGLRPGKRTADYLEAVVNRITYVGAAFLAVIAVVPSIISTQMGVNFQITQFLGGTGLLIVIQVLLDFISRIEASLTMHDYKGFSERDTPKRSGAGAARRKQLPRAPGSVRGSPA
jgi:preprotein translocase subunit SecY